MNNAGSLQNMEPVAQCGMHKYVAGEEGCLKFHTAVFPGAFALVQWQVIFYGAFSQLLSNTFFVIGTRVHGVPTQLDMFGRHMRLRPAYRSSSRNHFYLTRVHIVLRPVTYRAICYLTP